MPVLLRWFLVVCAVEVQNSGEHSFSELTPKERAGATWLELGHLRKYKISESFQPLFVISCQITRLKDIQVRSYMGRFPKDGNFTYFVSFY